MFEAQEKGQPKLVYAHSGHIDTSREEDSILLSTSISFVDGILKDENREPDPVNPKYHKKEIQVQVFQNQNPQKKQQQKDDLQSQKSIAQCEVLHHVQNKHPTPCEVGNISAKKLNIENSFPFKKDNLHKSQTEIENSWKTIPYHSNVMHNTHHQNATIINEKRSPLFNTTIPGIDRATICHTNNDYKDIHSHEKLSANENEGRHSTTLTSTNAEMATQLNVSSSHREHHVFSISSKSDHDIVSCSPGPSVSNISALKHGYVQSLILSNNQQIQKNQINHQQEQQHLKQQQQQIHRDLTEQVHDRKLNITAVRVNNSVPERQNILPAIPTPGTTQKLSNTSYMSSVSSSLNPLTLSSSMQTEGASKSELSLNSEKQYGSLTLSAINAPKSILKKSTSFDQDLSVKLCELESGRVTHNENISGFDFRSLLATYKEKLSKKKAIGIDHIDNCISVKTNSALPRTQTTSETTLENSEFSKDARVPKKSVTFNSEVRLLDDEISTFETLSMDC